LQARMNQFADRIEMAFRQALRIAVSQGKIADAEAAARASMLTSMVFGRWLRYAKTGFKHSPTEGAALQIAILLH